MTDPARPTAPALHPLDIGASSPEAAAGERQSRVAPRDTRLERSQRVARWAAQAGLDKKAERVEIVDVAGRIDYADYLVLMTGRSDRNVAAIARGVDADLAERGVKSLALEGLPQARWVLIDFVDVVVHVFQEEWRGVYDLDGLWMDAPRLPLEPEQAHAPVPRTPRVSPLAEAAGSGNTAPAGLVSGEEPQG